MIFEVSRTTSWYMSSGDPPCEGAFMTETPDWHIRTCTEEYYNKHYAKREGGLWRDKGTKHQITPKGDIKRQDGMRSCWGIKIKSLKELVEFSEKYGDLVFTSGEIEIYDGYRE